MPPGDRSERDAPLLRAGSFTHSQSGHGYYHDEKEQYRSRLLGGSSCAPFFPADGAVGLYVARQWNERSEVKERELLGHSAVRSLVFSSFRFDNAEAVAKGDWVE